MSKEIESRAYTHLEAYIREHLPGATLRDTRNKGRGHGNPDIADAVLEYGDRTYHVEIKASSRKGDHNIRFSHQTVTKAIGKDLVVALISEVEAGNPNVEFFKLSDVVGNLRVEPKFFVAAKHMRDKLQPLGAILQLPEAPLDVSSLLSSPVGHYVNLPSTDTIGGPEPGTAASHPPAHVDPSHPLWSPYVDATDSDGAPYPPWLKYPNMDRKSMGWRMGEGESYAEDFDDWLRRQPADVLQAYRVKFPAPPEWSEIWPRQGE